MNKDTKITRINKKNGFTLVELTVTLGITLIISTLVLANFPEFSRRLQLSRTVQAIALSFREAESAALAVREFGEDVFPAYGLHFENVPSKSYVFFADIDSDYKNPVSGVSFYDDPGEQIDMFSINTQPVINRICGGAASSPPGDCSIGWLDAVYVRPNPDIHIFTDKGSFTDAGIVVGLPGGQEEQIILWETGQLSVESLEQ